MTCAVVASVAVHALPAPYRVGQDGAVQGGRWGMLRPRGTQPTKETTMTHNLAAQVARTRALNDHFQQTGLRRSQSDHIVTGRMG